MKQGSILNFIKNSKNSNECDSKNNINSKKLDEPISNNGSKDLSNNNLSKLNIAEHKDNNNIQKDLVPNSEKKTNNENLKNNNFNIKSSNNPKNDIKMNESNNKRIKTIIDDAISDDDLLQNENKNNTTFYDKEIPMKIKSNENSILFSKITSALTIVEGSKGENSKDAIKEILCNLFKDIIENTPDDLSRLYYFLLSKVGPEYNSPEFGIGNENLVKCVAKATGKSERNVKDGIIELGDLALVASDGKKTLGTMEKFSGFIKTQEKKPLTLKKVFESFVDLANIKGKSSFTEKEKILVKLMFESTNEEIKYIIRSLQKSLKIGASFKTIIAALARCISRYYNDLNKKELQIEEKEVERILLISFNQLGNYDLIMSNIYVCIISKLNFKELINLCCITPGIPLKPQLARPTNGINVIFQRFDNVPFTCEYKYDGFRGQIHHYNCKKTGFSKTEIFSRNMENMTESYPDVVKFIEEKIHNEKVNSFILDCEIVAFDTKTNKIQPFQVLTTRARKNVNVNDISINVCMFLFDIIYLNEKCIIDLSLDERRKILIENFEESDHIKFAKFINSDKVEEIELLMTESIQAGCEGLIIKALYKNSNYQPGQRNFNWLKLKKDYLDTSVGDSLDLIPIGAEYGLGRRKGFYGSFLLACYNDENETYETVTMTGAGLTDENLESFYKELSQFVIPQARKDYRIGDLKVDVWFDCKIVWEIKTADLSLSPVYTSGNSLTSTNKGISLRFPRFIRMRPDKKPEEATTSEEIYKMWKNQSMNNNKIDFNNEDDFYD